MSPTTSLILIGIPALALAGTVYLFTCARYPFRACPTCRGTGRRHNPVARRTFGICHRCTGTGRQVRPGRRIYEHLTGKPRIDHRGRTR